MIRLLFLLICMSSSWNTLAANLELANNQKSKYVIIIPKAASAIEQKAALEFQHYFEEVSGVALPVLKDDRRTKRHEILIGNTNRGTKLPETAQVKSLQEDGFIIKAHKKKLYFLGGEQKGVLYAVYTFLEQNLNCRKYSSAVTIIPKKNVIRIPGDLYEKQEPVFTFREVLYLDTHDPDFMAWHKLDRHSGDEGEWGFWCHSFNQLVPPSEYGKTHSEYYSLIDGVRRPGTQLCLTNPDVLKITISNLRKAIDEKPNAKYWSVSQNDNTQYCHCENCAAIDKEEGTPMGSMLRFINQVATDFPDKTISTLAYQYTRSLPLNTRPNSNVNIMLCSIECFRDTPINEDATSASFCKDVEDWAGVTENILLWDYVIQFKNLVSPFPNLHVLQPNIRYLADQGIKAMFQQGNREIGGESSELRAYLIAKLLWDPTQDIDVLMDDFLNGYYGEAGPFLKKYIKKQEQALLESGMKLNIFGNPAAAKESYLSEMYMKDYNQIFDLAEDAVQDNPEILKRVKIARQPLVYAELEIGRTEPSGSRSIFTLDENGIPVPKKDLPKKLKSFIDLCNDQGVTRLKEWSTTPNEYFEAYSRLLSQTGKENLAYRKQVSYHTPFSQKYPANKEKTLTDGLRGTFDFAVNWQGFQADHMEVVLDLEEERQLKELSIDFLHATNDWIFQPLSVSFFGSKDGGQYQLISKISPEMTDREGVLFVAPFVCKPEKMNKFRFIKIFAENRELCPDWHHGAGGKAWIFADEIVIK